MSRGPSPADQCGPDDGAASHHDRAPAPHDQTAPPADQADPVRRREVTRQSLSVGAATGAYGLSFGALSVASGLDIWQTQALSALLFSG
ncbi:MAG: hypothetical protein ACRCYX_01105, partial [Dermatophilaceae bacterium]